MKQKRKLLFAAVLILIAGGLSILLTTSKKNIVLQNEEGQVSALVSQEDSLPNSKSLTTDSQRFDQAHKEEVQKGLETIFKGLKKMGAVKDVPTAMKTLSDAIASGEPDFMRRAFHEVTYGRFAQMSESIPAIKAHLSSSEPYVRYLAAQALLRMGDESGVEALIEILSNNGLDTRSTIDLRLSAAETLSKFNIVRAGESIQDLYANSKNGELLRFLSELGLKAHGADNWPYVSSALSITNYAKEGSTKFIPNIEETFNSSNDLKKKNAAAWALARMTGHDRYVSYLGESARSAIKSDARGGLTYNTNTKAIKYLGSVQSPQAIAVLESSLESQNPVVVQYATVNLLFNQQYVSQKAEQLVIDEFMNSPKILGLELAVQIAAKSSSAKIREAAEFYARRTGSDRWRYWGKERSNWPIENWVYDYVVTLNR